MRDELLWIRPGSDVYHDSKRCAGRHGLPTFPEIIAVTGDELTACGLCKPPEWVQCPVDGCERVFSGEGGMNQHRTIKHLKGAEQKASVESGSGDDLDRLRTLEAKSRGEQ